MGTRTIGAVALLSIFTGLGTASADGELSTRGFTMVWEEGEFARGDPAGDLRQIRFRFEDGVTGTADRLRFSTRMDGGDLLVERWNLTNFTIRTDDATLAGADFDWRLLRIDGASPLDDDFDFEQVSDPGRLRIRGLLGRDDLDNRFAIDEVLIESSPFTASSLPGLPFPEIEFSIRNLVPLPSPDAIGRPGNEFFDSYEEYENYLAFLDFIDRDELSVDMSLTFGLDEAPDRVNASVATRFEIDGLGEIAADLDFSLLNSTLRLIAEMGDEFDDWDLGFLSGGLLLNGGELRIRESGLIASIREADRRSGTEQWDGVVEDLIYEMAVNFGSFAPRTWFLVEPEIRGFLGSGGSLATSLRPGAPVPAVTLLGFAAAPDAAFSLLGFDMRHQHRP